MGRRGLFVLLAVAVGASAFVVALTGGLVAAILVGLAVLAVAVAIVATRTRAEAPDAVPDPSRRRLLAAALIGTGLALIAGGSALGHTLKRLIRPNPRPRLEADSTDVGAEYLELVTRAYHPERSGDLQLLVTPYSTSNYEQESLALLPRDPRTSHAVVWMYGQRVPIVVWSPTRVEPSDSDERVTLADLAPSTARLMGFDEFDAADGTFLPGLPSVTPPVQPRLIVTFVIDGGGWNVLRRWPDAWPNLKRLMREGATYRNAIAGSFPAVTASTHATIGTGAFPGTHGITGHNVRRDGRPVKAWGEAGHIDPSFLLTPTLADRWARHTENEAWVGELGYQVWHVGMLGHGGRPRGEAPVGVFWDEQAGGEWAPHHPRLYRLPHTVPAPERLDSLTAEFTAPDPSTYDRWIKAAGKTMCCFPPIVRLQGELIEATLDSEAIGDDEVTDLLYINFKAPDYSGHVYNMDDPRQAEVLAAVDAELGRLADLLLDRFGPGRSVLIVTADHGQCPPIDENGGVRIDPIQLSEDLEAEFGTSVFDLIESVAPSEIFLSSKALADTGASVEDVAAFISDYRYGQNIGPYVRPDAIATDRLGARTFAAVLPTSFIADLAARDLSAYGATTYPEADPDGIPPVTW
ncbi:MAG TPA: alkaline phosphatase family protein [Actinomycetota bacterium]|nr:alkaline phosphatase family protein [Actinomycetota bacterium]